MLNAAHGQTADRPLGVCGTQPSVPGFSFKSCRQGCRNLKWIAGYWGEEVLEREATYRPTVRNPSKLDFGVLRTRLVYFQRHICSGLKALPRSLIAKSGLAAVKVLPPKATRNTSPCPLVSWVPLAGAARTRQRGRAG